MIGWRPDLTWSRAKDCASVPCECSLKCSEMCSVDAVPTGCQTECGWSRGRIVKEAGELQSGSSIGDVSGGRTVEAWTMNLDMLRSLCIQRWWLFRGFHLPVE